MNLWEYLYKTKKKTLSTLRVNSNQERIFSRAFFWRVILAFKCLNSKVS
jgi:hypothetical protein